MFLEMGDVLGLTNPLKNATLEVNDYVIQLNPRNRSYYYEVSNPKNPNIFKKEHGDPLSVDMSPREVEAVRGVAVKLIEEEVKKHSKDGRLNWLGSVSLERWSETMDRNMRRIISVTIDHANLTPQEKARLGTKYANITMKILLRDHPEREIFTQVGGDNQREKRLEQNMAGAQIYGFTQSDTLEELGFKRNPITRAFFNEAVRLITGQEA